MTDLEINIAIAEACGWTCDKDTWTSPEGGRWARRVPGREISDEQILPNYCRDLNAMHDAEERFNDEIVDVKSMYWDYLALVAMPDPFPGDDTFLRDYVMIRATARQRAEAFLRTIGKRKE